MSFWQLGGAHTVLLVRTWWLETVEVATSNVDNVWETDIYSRQDTMSVVRNQFNYQTTYSTVDKYVSLGECGPDFTISPLLNLLKLYYFTVGLLPIFVSINFALPVSLVCVYVCFTNGISQYNNIGKDFRYWHTHTCVCESNKRTDKVGKRSHKYVTPQ